MNNFCKFTVSRYVNLIEAAYTWNMFIGTGLGMILINALGLQVKVTTSDR